MPVALKEILTWANTLPYWEKFALDVIMTDQNILESSYNQMIDYILEDSNLKEKTAPRPDLTFSSTKTDSLSNGYRPVLIEIRNLKNVNALAAEQRLTFSEQLTTIYGANGSGKSGYARVLGCAAFSRGDKEILPDINQPIPRDAIRAADIVISEGGSTRIIEYHIGEHCSELAAFYVFDSTGVEVHLNKSNTISFCPYGLSFLTRLSEITDICRDKLQQKMKPYLLSQSFAPFFQGETTVSRAVAILSSKTNIKELEKVASLSEEDISEFQQLDREIARLKSENIPRQIEEIRQTITDLSNLIADLSRIRNQLNDEAASKVNDIISLVLQRQSASQMASVDQFETENFTHIGSAAWHDFLRAAKTLADLEKRDGTIYPASHDACLLCHQSLSDKARDHIVRLWAFLMSNAQSQLREAEEGLRRYRSTLKAVKFDFFGEQFASYRFLKSHDEKAVAIIERFILAARRRLEAWLQAVDMLRTDSLESLPDDGVMEIQQIIRRLELRIEDLQRLNPEEKIKEFEGYRLQLQHRLTLSEKLPEIKTYIEQRKWAEKAIKAGGSTRHITQKYNDLFRQLVTDRYIEIFGLILEDLGRPLKVKVATRGRKGETIKQIVLEPTTSNNEEKATPNQVLSEGEKRA